VDFYATPRPMFSLSQASVNSAPTTLLLRAEWLYGVAVAAVLSDAVGVGSATAAVVSTSGAPRISAVRIADPAGAPTLFVRIGPILPRRERLWQEKSHTKTRQFAASSVLRSPRLSVFVDAIPGQA